MISFLSIRVKDELNVKKEARYLFCQYELESIHTIDKLNRKRRRHAFLSIHLNPADKSGDDKEEVVEWLPGR